MIYSLMYTNVCSSLSMPVAILNPPRLSSRATKGKRKLGKLRYQFNKFGL